MSTFGVTIQRNGWSPRSEQFYNQLVAGLEDEVIGAGHTVIVKIVAGRQEELETFAQWADDGSVDAVICKDITVDDDFEDRIRALGLRYAVLGDTQQPVKSNLVAVDNVAALRGVIDHLLGQGHRRIDWITGPAAQLHTQVRLKAFESYVTDGLIEGEARAGDYDVDRCRELVTSALRRDRPPTAFLVDGDLLATAAVSCVRRFGLDVPDEVSVISWDDSLICQRNDPPLSALDHHVPALGHGLGRCLIAEVAGESLRVEGTAPTLVIRASSQ